MPLLDWEIQDRGARDKHALFYGTSTGYRYRYPAALCVIPGTCTTHIHIIK